MSNLMSNRVTIRPTFQVEKNSQSKHVPSASVAFKGYDSCGNTAGHTTSGAADGGCWSTGGSHRLGDYDILFCELHNGGCGFRKGNCQPGIRGSGMRNNNQERSGDYVRS